MQEINFTKEHQARLGELVLDSFYNKVEYKGNVGTDVTIYDLYHNTSLNTLTKLYTATKKELGEIDNMDPWSLTDHYQRKQKSLKVKEELLMLLIGNKRYQDQIASKKAKLATLKEQYDTLKEDTKTPEIKMQELEKAMAELQTVDA